MTILAAKNAMEFDLYMEKKRIPVSSKGQITIPKKFINELNLGKEVDCIVDNGRIIIEPAIDVAFSQFHEYILRDLINDGFEGEELITKFKERSQDIKEAAQSMLIDAHKFASTSNVSRRQKAKELFEMEE